MITFENVSKVYNSNSVALKNVSMEIKQREFIFLVGASGAGKTTLLKLLIREEDPTDGKIFLDDLEISAVSRSQLHNVRRRIGMVFQDYKLLPMKTAYENISFAMEAAGRTDEEIEEDVGQVLDLVGLSEKLDNFPGQLSGGEQQRVAIARAMVNRPDVILADEVTGNLDPVNTLEIVKLLEKVNELGTTIIFATHNKELINASDRRVVILDKGEVISDRLDGKYLV